MMHYLNNYNMKIWKMKEEGDVLMPQLNKGGKFVFGLSLIHDDLTVQFPTQALEEYQVLNDNKIIILQEVRLRVDLRNDISSIICVKVMSYFT